MTSYERMRCARRYNGAGLVATHLVSALLGGVFAWYVVVNTTQVPMPSQRQDPASGNMYVDAHRQYDDYQKWIYGDAHVSMDELKEYRRQHGGMSPLEELGVHIQNGGKIGRDVEFEKQLNERIERKRERERKAALVDPVMGNKK